MGRSKIASPVTLDEYLILKGSDTLQAARALMPFSGSFSHSRAGVCAAQLLVCRAVPGISIFASTVNVFGQGDEDCISVKSGNQRVYEGTRQVVITDTGEPGQTGEMAARDAI